MIKGDVDITRKKYYQYAIDCIEGKQKCCLYTKLACERFLKDLDRPDLIFIPRRVDRVVEFCSKLKHFQGKSAGKYFILEPWQEFVTANIFGFYKYDEDGELVRRFNLAYIEMSRKQGKTALIAAYGLYGLIYDGEMSAEIILAATSREQAKICFNLCNGFAKSLDPKGKYLNILKQGIEYRKTLSILKVISADASKQDGFNASFGIVDEYHAHKTSMLFDVIKSSQGFRQNPLMFVITTAGFDKTAPCYVMRTSNIEILNEIKQDDSRFCIIYTLDENDNWKDEENWVKCSPNLGVTVKKSYIQSQVTSAINDPSEEVGVLTKNLNLWCDTAENWIPDQDVQECMKGVHVEFEDHRGDICYIGVDLASVNDLVAVSFLFDKDDDISVKNVYFLPEESLKTSPQKEYYREMYKLGYLILTPGNVVDYDFIQAYILKAYNDYDLLIQGIYYDKWNATQWAIGMTSAGMPMDPFSQTIANFNAPTKELQKRILKREIKIDTNLLTLFMFRNVAIKRDHNENMKPDKAASKNKIDGVISMIQAVGGYMIYNHIVDVF